MTKTQKTTIDMAMEAVQKKYGKGSVQILGRSVAQSVDVISTGSMALDQALGCGGYPKGRIIEVFGPESSGKTTLALHAIAETQKKGGKALFIDAEHALDVKYANALGVDTDSLVVAQPDYGEQALDIVDMMVRSEAFDIVVIDSVAALVPKAELDGEMGDRHVATQARMMSQALRKLTAIASTTKTTIFFINQIRYKIGVMFGSPETTTGGNALKFYASVRIDVRKRKAISKGADKVGNITEFKVVKNKLAPPFRTAIVDIVYGRGMDPVREVFALSVEHKIIEKKGAFYSLDGDTLGQGQERVIAYLDDNPDVVSDLRKKIIASIAGEPEPKLSAVPSP